MKKALFAAFFLSLLVALCSGQESKSPDQSSSAPQNQAQSEDLKRRFFVKYAGVLSASIWTLTHDYESKTEVDEVLKYLQKFFGALQENDEAKLREMGGVKGFKDKFLEFLKSKDGTVKGFAAVVLAITGDVGYAPPIAVLVEE